MAKIPHSIINVEIWGYNLGDNVAGELAVIQAVVHGWAFASDMVRVGSYSASKRLWHSFFQHSPLQHYPPY
jgi:hypothetical protein